MIKVKRIAHVGIAAKSTGEVLPFYELLGLELSAPEELPRQGVTASFLPVGEGEIELLEPLGTESGVAKFLERRGEGIHHLCLEVEDIDGAVKELLAAGIEMIDQAPRPGAEGHRVAFVHPRSTHGVLVELAGH
jgi:methylmalonyl-CoA epimerase